MVKLSSIKQLVPDKILSVGLRRWFKHGFDGGNINAAALWQGNLKNYPFTDNSGTFRMNAVVTDSVVTFHPQWLPLKHATGGFKVIDNNLQAVVAMATLGGDAVSNVDASFTKLVDDVSWKVTGNATGELPQALAVIQKSPLAVAIASKFQEIVPNGAYELALNLEQPSLQQAVATKGTITMKTAAVTTANFEINDIDGKFDFTNDTVIADNVSAKLFNNPLEISVKTTDAAAGKLMELRAKSKVSADDIAQHLKKWWLASVSGSSWFQAKLKLPLNYEADSIVTVKSDLEGMAISLPAPFYKTESQSKKLIIAKKIIN